MVTNPQSFDDLATLVRLDALHALTAIVDTGGTVRNANHAWAAAAERAETGLPPLAPVGGNLPAILRERAGGNPQDGAVLRALEASLCRGDAPVPLTYTGRAEPVPRSFLVEIDALAEGGASVTYVDVTLRRQINDILRAVAHVAAQVKEGSVVVDLQGTIQFADAGWAAMHGYHPMELIGRPITAVQPRDQMDGVIPPLRDAILARGQYQAEAEHLRKDGSRFPVEVRAALLRDERGEPSGFASIARDVTERRRAEETRAILTDAGAILAGALDEQSMLRDIAGLLVPRLADWCTVDSVGPEGAMRRALALSAGPEGASLAGQPAAWSEAARATAPGDGPGAPAALLETDFDEEPTPAPQGGSARVGLAERLALRARITAPLVARGHVLGVLTFGVCAPRPAYGAEELGLAEELARRTALAVDNARLYRELADRRAELQALIGRLLMAHEEERRRVAYDLHDGLAQVLAANHQRLQGYAARHRPRRPEARAELDALLDLARHAVRETRRVVAGLRPTALDDLGLVAALRLESDALRAEGREVSFAADHGAEPLPAAVEVALYRVAQEALTNARKHAGDASVSLRIVRTRGRVTLTVQDWGPGFDPGAVDQRAGPGERVGLAGMEERIALLGGELQVRSSPGEGTRISASVPLA